MKHNIFVLIILLVGLFEGGCTTNKILTEIPFRFYGGENAELEVCVKGGEAVAADSVLVASDSTHYWLVNNPDGTAVSNHRIHRIILINGTLGGLEGFAYAAIIGGAVGAYVGYEVVSEFEGNDPQARGMEGAVRMGSCSAFLTGILIGWPLGSKAGHKIVYTLGQGKEP